MFSKLEARLRRHGSQILTLASAACFASFTLPDLPWDLSIFVGGILAAGGAVAVEAKKQDQFQLLKDDLDSATKARAKAEKSLAIGTESARLVAHAVAVDVARLCESDGNTVRASVYERRENEWVRLARYSASAAYREGGRHTIPLGGGLLQRAFERAHAEAADLPDPDRAPVQYEKEQVKLGLEAGLSERLRMPSRSYAVFRFEGPPTEPFVRTFVLCVESTDPQGVIASRLDDLLKPWWWTLYRICVSIEPSSTVGHP